MSPSENPPLPIDLIERSARPLTQEDRERLATLLRLPVRALDRLSDLRRDPEQNCWLFPELDEKGHVVGWLCRFADGSKRMVPGSRRGLTIPDNFWSVDGPLLIVPSATDAMALAACGVGAIGRPGDSGGIEMLTRVLAGSNPNRLLVVCGVNDRKPDGSWPGRDGADHVARELTRALGRKVWTAVPPDVYRDMRDWVVDRAGGLVSEEQWESLGIDIAQTMGRSVKLIEKFAPVKPTMPQRFATPVPISRMFLPSGGVPWVWDGYLARGAVMLLSALPKCGKTTLLSHLLRALPHGGSFCGRELVPGRALVVSEESEEMWAARRDELGLTDAVQLVVRPFFSRPTSDDWLNFLRHLIEWLEAEPADLVVFDTLANLWPVRDENNASDVVAALQPLQKLAVGRSVLLVHHLRKSDGSEGTASRGSGAMTGMVDAIVELRRLRAADDPYGRRRALTGYGRYREIPAEWLVELDEETNSYDHLESEESIASGHDQRSEAIRDAVEAMLPEGPPGMTRKEIWDRLPEVLQANEVRFRSILKVESGKTWRKEKLPGRNAPYVYLRKLTNERLNSPGKEKFAHPPNALGG